MNGLVDPLAGGKMKVRIENEKITVYKDMDLSSSPIADLSARAEVELTNTIERMGVDWGEVILSDGQHGYILGDTEIYQIKKIILLQERTPVYERASTESAVYSAGQ